MKKCIINTEDKAITEYMEHLGFSCIPVIKSDRTSPEISTHSDVLYRKINSDTIMVSACQSENIRHLEKAGYNIIITDKLNPGYSTESYLNFIINDKYIISNPKTAVLLPTVYTKSKTEITVKQGYTSCSTLQVNDDAYITDDEGIYNQLKKYGISVLKIKKGNIQLSGYDYGFIGGASLRLDDKNIIFFGDIEDKEEKENVLTFLHKHNMNGLFISGKRLKDIGSALIL